MLHSFHSFPFAQKESLFGVQREPHHVLEELVEGDVIFAIGDVIKTLHELILIELERNRQSLKPFPVNDIFLFTLIALIAIENPLTYLFGIILMVMFLKFSDKLEELLFSEGLLLVVELFHKCQKDKFVLVTDLAYFVEGVIQGADYLGQKLQGDCVF